MEGLWYARTYIMIHFTHSLSSIDWWRMVSWSCWTVWTTIIVLYFPACMPPRRGDFLCVLLSFAPSFLSLDHQRSMIRIPVLPQPSHQQSDQVSQQYYPTSLFVFFYQIFLLHVQLPRWTATNPHTVPRWLHPPNFRAHWRPLRSLISSFRPWTNNV